MEQKSKYLEKDSAGYLTITDEKGRTTKFNPEGHPVTITKDGEELELVFAIGPGVDKDCKEYKRLMQEFEELERAIVQNRLKRDEIFRSLTLYNRVNI